MLRTSMSGAGGVAEKANQSVIGRRQKKGFRVERKQILKVVYTKLVGGYEYFNGKRISWRNGGQPV